MYMCITTLFHYEKATDETSNMYSLHVHCIFMAHRAIPMIPFHEVECIYILYLFVSQMRLCIIYVVKEVALFQEAQSINQHGT